MSYYKSLKTSERLEPHEGSWMRGMVSLLSLVFSVGLLYKNEISTMSRQILFDAVSSTVVELGNNPLVNSAHEGKLVYLKGRIEVNEPLSEPEYGVTIPAVKLKRRVQMYQWVEVQEHSSSWWGMTMDEVSPISYSTAWRDRLIDSSQFVKPYGHANPKSFPVDSGVSVSDTVRVGSYTLSQELKELLSSFTLLTSDQRPERRDIKMHSGLYYHSFDVWNPEVGDTRVQLSYAGASDDVVTILARQVGTMLQPYYTETKELTTLLEGEHLLGDVLAIKFPSPGVWLIRIPAYFAVYCAYSSLMFIFSCAAGKQSRLIQAFFNTNKNLLCHILSAATIFLIMGLTWFSYNPLLGSINLSASFILAAYSFFKTYSLYYYFNR